jgi:glutathione-specific gamma-glutamylcyclotransferase
MKDSGLTLGLTLGPAPARTFWVFGYGSLMWRPGFSYLSAAPATLFGYHRRLCIYSHQYRGTPEKPGLVFGLDRGGSCHGMAFEVEDALWPETLAYLRDREQLTNVYLELFKKVRFRGSEGHVTALAFIVNRSHAQYAGELSDDEILHLVAQGNGSFGACTEYVRNTVEHLRELNIRDQGLERLMTALERKAP